MTATTLTYIHTHTHTHTHTSWLINWCFFTHYIIIQTIVKMFYIKYYKNGYQTKHGKCRDYYCSSHVGNVCIRVGSVLGYLLVMSASVYRISTGPLWLSLEDLLCIELALHNNIGMAILIAHAQLGVVMTCNRCVNEIELHS